MGPRIGLRLGMLTLAVGLLTARGAAAPPLEIDVPMLTSAPTLDGVIAAGEYGPGLLVTFEDLANPGAMWRFSADQTLPASQLSFTMYTGFTATDLYLAFEVVNPEVAGQPVSTSEPYLNDSMELFIAGTPGSTDFVPGIGGGSREAFQLVADKFGNQFTVANEAGNGFTNADWQVGVNRDANGYGLEFRIPLSLIATPGGIAGPGSMLMFNAATNDNNSATEVGPSNPDFNQGILWANANRDAPFATGVPGWQAELNLVPEPSSYALTALGGAVLVTALRRRKPAA